MADFFPPDGDRRAGTNRSDKSGKVADFRYKRSSKPKAKGKPGHAKPHGRNSGKSRRRPERDDSRGNNARAPASPPTFAPHNQTRPHPRQAYAALDLGTNNCRLLIARPSGPDFTVIDAFSRVVRLGEGLANSGRLSDEAMDRTLGALSICADKLRRRNVFLARSVATEACRRAANGAAFIERVRQETGIALDIISAQEEARLAVLGCHILLEQGDSPAVIFDIGGGSTELVLLEPGEAVPRIVDWQSVPWGVVSLSDTVPRTGYTDADRSARYAEMRRVVRDSFTPFAERIGAAAKGPDIRLLGTSGTVTTLASLHLELPHYDRNAVDGLIVPSHSMRAISTRLSAMSPDERSQLPCIGRDRAELVVAGCAILESILDIWPAQRLGVADRGIREGILRSLMAAELKPHPAGQEAS
ncbi:exopolyphosphatase / guanosine-5'-triphosphate,3'-diphosphate pyrophosphatase [Altererythrobacter xiamenensis]|uniref:Exopolyphosphatase / guanosine-5'-triphosphate,3'-diphosphate pyrophosphatase n=1 Tax=Altererythrobacter xiamenensis TaxID=1316679 RepID=A0A1Y6F561_9SPHN|nr:Ppx/GppA phosphatase family protein [Altererythrobacter xiamenensis]SMQ69586.1 exopolyphosphatase / guanosine-5'-triphosphate,3'-diphosphate pyrophosphatase [Altererythrobacter xiamenensis]